MNGTLHVPSLKHVIQQTIHHSNRRISWPEIKNGQGDALTVLF
jgi:hypothetical protein